MLIFVEYNLFFNCFLVEKYKVFLNNSSSSVLYVYFPNWKVKTKSEVQRCSSLWPSLSWKLSSRDSLWQFLCVPFLCFFPPSMDSFECVRVSLSKIQISCGLQCARTQNSLCIHWGSYPWVRKQLCNCRKLSEVVPQWDLLSPKLIRNSCFSEWCDLLRFHCSCFKCVCIVAALRNAIVAAGGWFRPRVLEFKVELGFRFQILSLEMSLPGKSHQTAVIVRVRSPEFVLCWHTLARTKRFSFNGGCTWHNVPGPWCGLWVFVALCAQLRNLC